MGDLEGVLRLMAILLNAGPAPESEPPSGSMRDLGLYLWKHLRTFDRDVLSRYDTEILNGANAISAHMSPIFACLPEATVAALLGSGDLTTITVHLAMALFAAGYRARTEDEKEEQNDPSRAP